MKSTSNISRGRHSNSLHKQRGNMLLQALVVIAIMSAFLLIGARGMRYVNDVKAQSLVAEWGEHAVKAPNYAGTHGGTFASIDTENCASYFFDKKQVSGTGASTVIRATEGKGVVTCAPAQTVTANDSIAFTYGGYTEYVCKKAVMDGVANVTSIAVGSTTVKSPTTDPDDKSINAACLAGGENNSITVTFSR